MDAPLVDPELERRVLASPELVKTLTSDPGPLVSRGSFAQYATDDDEG